jgi:uncharacterized protein (DUF1697 family)
MPVIIGLLRGVNLAGHKKIKMEDLRALCDSLGLHNSQTYVQSGNVIFRTTERNLARLASRIEDAIEKKAGFHSSVILRTPSDLKAVIARNPFATRPGIEPGKLIVTFLPADPAPEMQDAVRNLKTNLEEVRLHGREVYTYFPDGMGRSKLVPVMERILKKSGTGRNWNTVTKLLEMAEALENAR